MPLASLISPGPSPEAAKHLDERAVGSERPDFGCLVVQHVDGAVAGGLDPADVAEDVVGVALEDTELEVRIGVDDLRGCGVDGRQGPVAYQRPAARQCLADGAR